MAEVKRRKNESFDGLLRRFTRRVSDSGRLLEARKIRFHARTPNRNKKRASALRRLEIARKREWLLKTGLLIEEKTKGRGFQKSR